MAQAFFHRGQHIRIAPRLHEDDPVGMEPGKLQRRREEIAPAQAPEDGAVETAEDAGEKDGRRCVIGQLSAAADFVQGTRHEPASRKSAIDLVNAERQSAVPRADAFDQRDLRPKIGNDGRLTHDASRDSQMRNSNLESTLGPA